MRKDGKRVRPSSAIESAIPYIMPKRFDAENFITEYVDMEPLRSYIHEKRREGIRLSYMSLVLAAYFKTYQKHPKINRFIMNKRIYQRNHFCVSFVMLKHRSDGMPDEAALKVFFEDGDDVFSIHRKIEALIEKNKEQVYSNAADKFAKLAFSLPLLPGLVFGLARLMDTLGLLPRKLIDLSPFHTSLFITNLASINTNSIFHHCYQFGTTGVFLCMGKPQPNYIDGEHRKKIIPLSFVMDERICTGHDYAQFCFDFRRYLKHPEMLEADCAEEKSGKAPEEQQSEIQG